MNCKYCGKEIDESFFDYPLTFCPHCGGDLRVSEKEAAEPKVFCPHCGKELPGMLNFCPYCGGEVAKHVTPRYERADYGKPGEPKAPVAPPAYEHKRQADKLYKEVISH